MPRSRPGSLTVAAVLAIIYGSLATTCNLCGIGALAAEGPLSQGLLGGDPQQAKLQKHIDETKERDVPGYRASRYAFVIVDLLLGIAMLGAGIGLLGIRSWARLLALLTALAAIVVSIMQAIYQTAFVIPATSRALTDIPPDALPQVPPGAPDPAKIMAPMLLVGEYAGVGIVVLVIVYLLIMVLLLVRRDVRAAFSRADAPVDAIASGHPGGEPADEGWGASAPPPKPEDEWGIERQK